MRNKTHSNRMKRYMEMAVFLLPFFILCALLCSVKVSAEESSLIPHPDQFPGEKEAAFYAVLEEKISQYGMGAEYYDTTHVNTDTGLIWAQLLDMEGNGNVVLALAYDKNPDDTENPDRNLEIYSFSDGKAQMIHTEPLYDKGSVYPQKKDGGVQLLLKSGNADTKLLIMRNGSVEDMGTVDSDITGFEQDILTAYYDSEGTYQCISKELADTLEQLCQIRLGSLHEDNEDWTKLYASYVQDLYEKENMEFCLYDVDDDGIFELFHAIGPTMATSDYLTGGCVTADTDCIHIVEGRTNGIRAGGGKIAILSDDVFFWDIGIYSLSNHQFSEEQILGRVGIDTTDEYYIDHIEVSKSEYEGRYAAIENETEVIFANWGKRDTDEEEYYDNYDRESILDVLSSMSGKRGLNGGNTAMDDYTGLIGLPVSESEGCRDMNSAYAFAIRNLIDLYGLAEYHLDEYSIFSNQPSCNGVCWAGLLSTNPEQVPYLAVVRWDMDYLDGFAQYHIYIYSWEGGKLILKNWIGATDYWVADMDGKVKIVSVSEGYLIYNLDSSEPALIYEEEYYDNGEDYDDEDYEELVRYRLGDNIVDYEDYCEAVLYLQACRVDIQNVRYYVDSDKNIYGRSSSVEDLYSYMSQDPSYFSHFGIEAGWKDLYQLIISIASQEPAYRYSLVYLDADQIPELVIKDYAEGYIRIVTSDGTTADSVCYQEDMSLQTADRLGSIMLISSIPYYEMDDYHTAFVIGLAGGRFTLKGYGGYSASGSLYIWDGDRLGAGDAGHMLYQAKVDQLVIGIVILRPKFDPDEVLRLLNALESGVVLTVSDSWTEEEAQAYKEQISPDYYDDSEDYDDSGAGDYEDYEEEPPYTGPADLSTAAGDWEAVNEADLIPGDPVNLPGDFYTDGQERYKETGYILPQSATKYLTEEDIAHLTMKGCCYARNEIYARHDRQFQAVELQDYFNSRDWYTGRIDPVSFTDEYSKTVFNDYEFYNANFLWKYETDHGMYWPQ